MPAEAISLALAASIYPPALAVVIALGRGVEVRLRVVLLVVAAYLTVLVTGILILLLFGQLGATSEQVRTPSAAVYVLGGLVLLWFAARLRGRAGRPASSAEADGAGASTTSAAATSASATSASATSPSAMAPASGPSRTERYLASRRLVMLLAVILYVVPSPIYIGALKEIADTNASAATQLGYLVVTLLVMLWIIELPMLLLIAFPDRGVDALERVNAWFARHGRALGALAAAVAGGYLIVVGVVELIG